MSKIIEIGFEEGGPAGLSSEWNGNDAFWHPNGNGFTGAFIPTGMRVVKILNGSFTIKRDGIEILARIVCGMGGTVGVNSTPIWDEEADKAQTIQIVADGLPTDDPNLAGDGYKAIWVEFQDLNNTGNVMPGADFEFQVSLLCE